MKYILQLFLSFAMVNTNYAQKSQLLNKHSNIYIVRHGEKQKEDDPLLTEEGNKRAGDLMRALKDKKSNGFM